MSQNVPAALRTLAQESLALQEQLLDHQATWARHLVSQATATMDLAFASMDPLRKAGATMARSMMDAWNTGTAA